MKIKVYFIIPSSVLLTYLQNLRDKVREYWADTTFHIYVLGIKLCPRSQVRLYGAQVFICTG